MGAILEHFELLKSTKTFKDSTEFEAQAMMFCFKTRFQSFEKNMRIVSQGDVFEEVVLILKGAANVESLDSSGEISITTQLKKGDLYGLEMAYAGIDTYKESLVTTEKTFVLFLNKHRLINPCQNHCKRHEVVVRNLMNQLAYKNIDLLDKITHITKKTIREKLLSYFRLMCEKSKSNYFEIPFNKTQLASYLSVDRSAMSSELSKMKKEGIIDFEKRQFHLIKQKKEN